MGSQPRKLESIIQLALATNIFRVFALIEESCMNGASGGVTTKNSNGARASVAKSRAGWPMRDLWS